MVCTATDGGDEQVGRVQLGQDAGGVAAWRQCLAQRRVELPQDAGAQQEVAHIGRLAKLHADRKPKHYNIQDIELDAKEDVCDEEEETWSYDPAAGVLVVKDRPGGVLARPRN